MSIAPRTTATTLRAVAALALAGSALVALGGPARAAAAPGGPALTVTPGRVEPGAPVSIALRGFASGQALAVTLEPGDVALGDVTAGSDGSAALTAIVPVPTALGDYQVVATTPSGSTAAAPLTVAIMLLTDSGYGDDESAVTGGPTDPPAAADAESELARTDETTPPGATEAARTAPENDGDAADEHGTRRTVTFVLAAVGVGLLIGAVWISRRYGAAPGAAATARRASRPPR